MISVPCTSADLVAETSAAPQRGLHTRRRRRVDRYPSVRATGRRVWGARSEALAVAGGAHVRCEGPVTGRSRATKRMARAVKPA